MKRRDFVKLGATAVAVAGTGCATGSGASEDHFTWELQSPERAGISSDGLPGVRAAIQQAIDANVQTGVVTAFARNNKLVWYEAQGVRNVETGEAMRRDDIFRMASSTKLITSAAVMMMSDAGRLNIDDPVSRYIPSFANPRVAMPPEGWLRALTSAEAKAEILPQIRIVPAQREITIKDLLTHTSGLSSAVGFGPGPGLLVNEAAIQEASVTNAPTLADRIPKVGNFVLDFEPGSRWGYSALDGMDTLLHVVEIVSGQEAESFLNERIFAPLEMVDSHFNLPEAKRGRLVSLYDRRNDTWQPGFSPFGNGPTTYICGAGGLMSTAHDYLNFEIMLLNGGIFNGRRLLRPETVQRMRTNHVGNLFAEFLPAISGGRGFGLGGAVVLDPQIVGNGRAVGAYGWPGAHGTDSWIDPENGVAAVYFVQQSGDGGRAYGNAIRDALL